MSIRSLFAAVGTLCVAPAATLAQAAVVSLSAPSDTVAPGDTVIVTLAADYDTASAGAGIFGTPGFYGFGGNVVVSGSSAGDVSATGPSVNVALESGVTTSLPAAPLLVRAAAGRGLDGGLAEDPAIMLTIDVIVDPGAAEGSVTLDFDGAVVLALGSTLTTFSTAPGVNQSTLVTSPLTLTIGGACPCEYDGNDALVEVGDLLAFLADWFAGNPAADIDGAPGVDVGDLLTFLACWFPASGGAGCP